MFYFASVRLGLFLMVCTLVLPAQAGAATAESSKGKQEYVTTAKSKPILRSDLAASPGKEVQVLELELAPGWVGDRHYHTGDVFVYVLEGQFVLDVDGHERRTLGPGEIIHEAVNAKMLARNGAQDKPTKLLLFQVGDKGEPLMIKTD